MITDDRYDELCAEYFAEYDSSWACVDDDVDGGFFDWWDGLMEEERTLYGISVLDDILTETFE